ncbi:MAG TPA: hypothetical protein VMH03_09635, partial [Terriglobales bacterium]|nr:hypothetical protein [Terriglobales bacterium]
ADHGPRRSRRKWPLLFLFSFYNGLFRFVQPGIGGTAKSQTAAGGPAQPVLGKNRQDLAV